MKKVNLKWGLIALWLIAPVALSGQSVEEAIKTINPAMLKGQLNFLASDWMEGRESETRGGYMAGDYIASMFQVYGLEPAGDSEYDIPADGRRYRTPVGEPKPTYFQKYNIIKYKLSDNQLFSVVSEMGGSRISKSYDFGTDYSVTGVATNTEIEAPLVFVGYGVKNDSLKYNDFAKIDVKGKIIIRLEGYPGYSDTSSLAYKKFKFSNLFRDKDRWALQAGAVGVINLSNNPGRDLGKPLNLPFRYQNGEIEGDKVPERFYDKRAILAADSLPKSLPVVRLSARLQNELLSLCGINLVQYELNTKLNMKPGSILVPALQVKLKVGVQSELMTIRNVIGKIEGEQKDEIIVIGAHYDHLGKYGEYIYNGADDNGSGTVGMMSIARAMKALGKKPRKTIYFAAWSAEEKGLLGSTYFVRNFKMIDQVIANVNFDMIARSTQQDSLKNKCGLSYTAKYEGFKSISEQMVHDYHLNLDVKYNSSEKPSGGSDFAPFAAKNIPIIAFMAAMHPDYHRPTDEVVKIDWKKMEQIVKLGFLDLYQLANADINNFQKPNH